MVAVLWIRCFQCHLILRKKLISRVQLKLSMYIRLDYQSLKFPGFATEGEVSRHKGPLLSSLSLDGVEVDTPHGIKIPHIVFQYNPPYTIPIVRRNEIAIPVRSEEDFVDETNINLESKWKDNGTSDDSNNDEDDDGAGAPSDVE